MKTWKICYRTGGTANFRWQYSTAYTNERDAKRSWAECIVAGYKAYVYDDLAQRIGMPDDFGPSITSTELNNARLILKESTTC